MITIIIININGLFIRGEPEEGRTPRRGKRETRQCAGRRRQRVAQKSMSAILSVRYGTDKTTT